MQALQHRARPRPAQPGERLGTGPGAFALEPVGLQHAEQVSRGGAQEGGGGGFVRRGFDAERVGDAVRGGDGEAGGQHEGEEFEQVEAGQIRIAEPAGDQRRVQQNHRRFGRPRNRLPPADRLGASVRMGDPDPAMGGVEGGIGQV